MLGIPPPDPGFELFVASHGMSQGLLQTEGAQVIPRITLRLGDMQIGTQWRNISSPLASGIAPVFAKFRGRLGKTQFEVGAFYRIRTGRSSRADKAAWEFDGAVRHSFGRIGIRGIVEYAPREFEAGRSLYVEGGPTYAIAGRTSLSVNIGRRERDGPDYTTANGGITQAVGKLLSVDARLYGTNHGERGARYSTRLIVSARLTI